ncbi:DUF2577 domain-containing protein [Paenibacillus spongiae]|uniref:DUF2577 domain-containing protein n=1 Tax=Paenibacillus spongiae TaxID=2909671 RepID=A0ABY5SEY4_9BACL|nr:DUF2577 domain-containing protein [Paenibacillus spongiae]UVI32093.1 DUF2577 domain-containing protein [Paenibacillus spongiae]
MSDTSWLIQFIRDQANRSATESIVLAEVISSQPLKIKVNNLVLSGEFLLVADYLLKDYQRQVSSGATPYTLKFEDTVNVGDQLAVINSNGIYIVIARVVTTS